MHWPLTVMLVGALPTPHTIWRFWELQPVVLIGLGAAAALYSWGLWRTVRRRADHRRALTQPQRWRWAAFLAALLTLGIALVSPLDALADVLFAAHMAQHLLLLLVAPLLLALSRPLAPLLWGLPPGARRTLAGPRGVLARLRPLEHRLRQPVVVWGLHTAAVWGWHAPLLYQAALRNTTVHGLEHLSFLGAAWLLWATALFPAGGRRAYGMSVLLIFLTALPGGVLGALLTFSSTLWYPVYAPVAAHWGIQPLTDQQLAGLLMWVPSGIVYLGAAAVLFMTWLAAVAQAVQRREHAAQPVQPAGG